MDLPGYLYTVAGHGEFHAGYSDFGWYVSYYNDAESWWSYAVTANNAGQTSLALTYMMTAWRDSLVLINFLAFILHGLCYTVLPLTAAGPPYDINAWFDETAETA